MQNRQKYFQKNILFFRIEQGVLDSALAELYTTFNTSAVKDVQRTPWNQKIPEDWENTESVPEGVTRH